MNHDDLKSLRQAQRRAHFDRRRFLKGLGACVALPAFESLMPRGLRAAELTSQAAATPATTAAGAPVRMAFVYFPNGAIQDNWWPTGEGADFRIGQNDAATGRSEAARSSARRARSY